MNKKSKFSAQTMAAIGVMAALVFITTRYLQIPMPVTIRGKTRIHLGNSMCILAGLLFGGLPGGLAAGIGSAIVDLMDPLWAPEFYITFINKFMMGLVAGLVSRAGKKRSTGKNILAAALGEITYIILYLTKTFIKLKLLGQENRVIWPMLLTRLGGSLVNGALAVVISVLLCHFIAPVIDKENMFRDRT
jgi:uncharacterized membrane protein